jgi:FHS family L-fucose permease-like MFS transporter
MGIGAFLFIPAASSASYLLFLLALVTLATGIIGLQVAANPYDPEAKLKHSGFNPGQLGGGDRDRQQQQCCPDQTDSIWRHPNLLYGAIGIFAYVGAKVSIGSFLVSYLEQPEVRGISAKTAAGFVSFYWGGAMIGRFIGAVILRRVRPGYLLAICAISAATLVIASMLASGSAAMWTILSVGLFNSIMFPTIFSLGVAEQGPLTVSGSGMLSMAIVGGAVLPVAQGVIADHVGLHQSFVLPVVCYLFIVFYGLSGSKPNSARQARA